MHRAELVDLSTLIAAVETNFRGRGWHGPSLLGSLRGIAAATALKQPAGFGHSIWALALHAAYWKYAVRRRFVPGSPGFPREPSNWPRAASPPSDKAWKEDLRLLKREHAMLVEAASTFDPRRLNEVPPGGRTWTFAELLAGAAAHDVYHTGQIQLVKARLKR